MEGPGNSAPATIKPECPMENLMSAIVRLEFDTKELAESYERSSDPQFRNGKDLVEALDIVPGEHVLDVGAGTGRLAEYVAGLLGPEGLVVAVDPLPLRIEIAASKGKDNFRSLVGRAEDLSAFADSTFDVVYLNSAFHWVADKPKAVSEFLRVLKPGGRLGLNSADPETQHQSAVIVREILEQEGLASPESASSNHPSTRAELKTLLENAGFKRIEVEQRTFVDFHKGAEELLAHSRSSSFGNSLRDLGAEGYAQLRDHLARRLEEFRAPEGIRLERYLNFALAKKPA
jgi:arsenite methyltransferase